LNFRSPQVHGLVGGEAVVVAIVAIVVKPVVLEMMKRGRRTPVKNLGRR
jgi:hypothetical protein